MLAYYENLFFSFFYVHFFLFLFYRFHTVDLNVCLARLFTSTVWKRLMILVPVCYFLLVPIAKFNSHCFWKLTWLLMLIQSNRFQLTSLHSSVTFCVCAAFCAVCCIGQGKLKFSFLCYLAFFLSGIIFFPWHVSSSTILLQHKLCKVFNNR